MSIPKLRINNHMSQTEQQFADTINNIIENIDTNKVSTDGDKVLSDNNYDDTDKEKVDNLSGVNTGDQKISLSGQTVTLDKDGGSFILPPATKGAAWNTTLPSNPVNFVSYPYNGTSGVTIGGIIWNSGDDAQWNGSVWSKIPVLSNVYTKDESFKISPFYDGVFGKTDTAAILLVHKAIKSIRLIGDWDKTNRYVIRYLSNNSGTTPYSIVIDQVDVTGTSVPQIPYNTNIVFTPAFAPTINSGKPTTVLFNKIGNRQVLAVIDYSILAANTAYNFGASALNFVIKPDNIIPFNTYENYLQDISGCTYNAEFGLNGGVDTTAVKETNKALKSIQLLGDWDVNTRYRINQIARNSATVKDQLIIESCDATGTLIEYVYATPTTYEVTNMATDKPTRVVFPQYGQKQVIAIIDYRQITDGAGNGCGAVNNYVIKPSCIDGYLETSDFIVDAKKTYLVGETLDFDYVDHIATSPTPKNNVSEPIKLLSNYGVNNKKGIINFRIDDNYEDKVFDAIFDKFGYKVTYSLNPHLSYITTGIDRQRRGHEICDHTPEHNCDWFTIPTDPIGTTTYTDLFATFIGHGLDSIVDGKAFLTKIYYNANGDVVTTPTTPATELEEEKIGDTFTLVSGSNEVTGDFTDIFTNKYYFLYIDNQSGDKIGWVSQNTNTLTTTKAYILRPDAVAVNATENESGVNVYALKAGDQFNVILTEEATYVLMLAGQIWFESLGFAKPKVWSQNGGLWAAITPEFATSAIKRLGMIWSTGWDGGLNENRILTYNMNRAYPQNNTFTIGLDIGDMSYSDLGSIKILLAEYIATHKVVTLLTHHLYAHQNFGGIGLTSDERIYEYRKFVYDLLLWCFENNVVIASLSEIHAALNNSTPDKTINIIPNLYTNIASQSKPDGHTLGTGTTWVLDDGVPEDKLHCLKRTTASSSNPITTITNLGGLEKGENQCGVWIKGSIGDTVTIWWGGIKTSTFLVDSEGWNKFTDTLIIPYTTNFMTIVIKGTIIDSDCRISGIYLHK